jgi:tRNA nucleotidyltransferase (CCA-adding enzyme)
VDPARLPEVAVAGWARELAGEVAEGEALARRLDGLRRRSEVDRILRRAKAGAAVGAAATGSQAVAGWWREDRDRMPEIGGADLIAAGVAPGPAIGRALEAVRAALLDGEVAGRDNQLELALRVVAEDR